QAIAEEFNKKKLSSNELTGEIIKKKIHGIRTQFLSEISKIKKSEVSGASHDDVYTPKLWCFDQLVFLQQGSEVVSSGESNLMLPSNICTTSILEDELDSEIIYEGDVEDLRDNVFSPTNVLSQPLPSGSSSQSSFTPQTGRGKKRKQSRESEEQLSGLFSTAVSALEGLNKAETTGLKHLAFARYITS
ncbi:unnamed protein product, partial [Brassicogethes aeneus]